MNKTILVVGLLSVYVIGYYGMSGVAFAQYLGNVGSGGETGISTLEETLELAVRKIEAAEANPGSGSGTPILGAEGIGTAIAVTAIVFGGVAGTFMIKSRSGKYAAYGRG